MVSELDWNKSRMWQNHCKKHRKLYDVQSSECLKSHQIPENYKVVELFDRIPTNQKSYQSAVNSNGFMIFCEFLPSIRRLQKSVQETLKNHCKTQSEWLRTDFSHSVQTWVLTCKNHATMTLWSEHEKSGKWKMHCKNQSKHDVAQAPK